VVSFVSVSRSLLYVSARLGAGVAFFFCSACARFVGAVCALRVCEGFTYTHTHTHTHMYIYIYVCMYVIRIYIYIYWV
jgi:hypothetical protein